MCYPLELYRPAWFQPPLGAGGWGWTYPCRTEGQVLGLRFVALEPPSPGKPQSGEAEVSSQRCARGNRDKQMVLW